MAEARVPGALAVLFVGNSYTSANDLPGALGALVRAADSDVRYTHLDFAPGAATLEDHWKAGLASTALAHGRYTHLVLQGQSVEPLLDPTGFARAAQRLGTLALTHGARPVFYGTWARAPGHAVYAERWSGGDPKAMQEGLTRAYRAATSACPGAGLALVGEAFALAQAQRPDLALLQADGSHPTLAGTALAACVLFLALTSQAVPELVPTGLTPDEASFLRTTAALVQGR